MHVKKVCSLGLSVVLALSVLAGCSSGGSGSASSASSGSSASSSTASSAKKVTITLMTSGTASTDGKNFDTDLFPKYVNEAFPNVTVQATELPDDQYYTSLKTKLAAGSAPDMFLVQPKSAGDNAVSQPFSGRLLHLFLRRLFCNSPIGILPFCCWREYFSTTSESSFAERLESDLSNSARL